MEIIFSSCTSSSSAISFRPSSRYSEATSFSVASIIIMEKVNPKILARIICLIIWNLSGVTTCPVILEMNTSCLSSSSAIPSNMALLTGLCCILASLRYTSASVASILCSTRRRSNLASSTIAQSTQPYLTHPI